MIQSKYFLINHTCLFIIQGNFYISDTDNHRIRKVTVSTGFISTIAGTGTAGFSGDGGDATSAMVYSPHKITLDSSGKCLAIALSFFFSPFITINF